MLEVSTENTVMNAEQAETEVSEKAANCAGGKFLAFFLGDEEYGLEILKVYEIIGMLPITPVPRTPTFIRGVINLRGKVIPVMDMRARFGMPAIPDTEETCIIVVKAQGVQMGIVVDRVSEVLDIRSEEIEDAPAFGAQVNTEYILGIGKSNDSVKILLDIDKVLSRKYFNEIVTLTKDASEEGTTSSAVKDEEKQSEHEDENIE